MPDSHKEPHRWCNGYALAWSAVDRGSQPRLGHTTDYKIGICCSPLSTLH